MTSELTLARARRGDAEALGALYREHHPAILRYLRGLGVADAEDLGTQVWIDAARALERFRGDGDDFRRLLFTIARRRMIDAHRARARRPEVAMAEPPPAAVGVGGPGDARTADPAEVAADHVGWATEVLALLPPAQAEVVMLRVVLGFEVDEVARLVDRSPGAVRVLAHRGLTRLRTLLDPTTGPATVTAMGRTAPSPDDPELGVTPGGPPAMYGRR